MRIYLIVLLLSIGGRVIAEDWQAIDPKTASRSEVPEYEAAPSGGDFVLQSAKGTVSLKDLRGQVVLLYFGYTSCPDVCPTALAILSVALDQLDQASLDKVAPLFISVDPERDDVAKLAEYATYYHDELLGLTGSEQKVAEVSKLYGAKYYQVDMQGSAMGYSVNHSSATYLIDPQGELAFIFPHATPSKVIAEAITYVLDNQQN